MARYSALYVLRAESENHEELLFDARVIETKAIFFQAADDTEAVAKAKLLDLTIHCDKEMSLKDRMCQPLDNPGS